MIQNQFGRRNLDNYVKGSLSLRLEEYFKAKGLENKKVGGKVGADITNGNRDCQISDKAVEKIDTKKELAKVSGVSYDTIYKVKEIKSQTPAEILSELENNIITHKVSINQAHKFVRAINSFKSKVTDSVE